VAVWRTLPGLEKAVSATPRGRVGLRSHGVQRTIVTRRVSEGWATTNIQFGIAPRISALRRVPHGDSSVALPLAAHPPILETHYRFHFV
jgi:hypothetical protein